MDRRYCCASVPLVFAIKQQYEQRPVKQGIHSDVPFVSVSLSVSLALSALLRLCMYVCLSYLSVSLSLSL